MRQPRLSALLFDFGGTLDADGVAWKERFRRLWRQEVGPVETERFDRAFYEADDALVGALPPKTSLQGTARLLAMGICRRLAGEESAAELVAGRFSTEALQRLCASAALLAQLAPRYRLAVVSNFYGNLAAVCAQAGLAPHLTASIDSAVLGFSKPDRRIFEAALDAVGARPEEALFVGDSLARDSTGARAVGMRHVLIAEGPAAPCCPEDPVLRHLSDLPEILA